MQASCPVHKLGHYLDGKVDGEMLFEGISASDALQTLRHILGELSVKDSDEYRTHDLRRGHALDMQLSGSKLAGPARNRSAHMHKCAGVAGAPLYLILQAGEWASPAFLKYLDMWRLEARLPTAAVQRSTVLSMLQADAVLEAHMEDSDGEELELTVPGGQARKA